MVLKDVVLTLGLGMGMGMAVGCGETVCDKAASVAEECGEDKPSDSEVTACEASLESCSDSDKEKLSDFYDCISENDCADDAFLTCASKTEGISEQCSLAAAE